MKISSRGRYGLKAMIDIAVYSQKDCVSIKSIAQRQSISEAYLEQLIPCLKKAGLVKSTRGPNGGYTLTQKADKINVGAILRALEDSFNQSTCGGQRGTCSQSCQSCVSGGVWEKINQSLNETADSINLETLAQEYKQLHNIE